MKAQIRRVFGLKTTRELQAFRGVLLVLSLELVSLQAVKLAHGEYALGVFLSFAGCALAGVYVLLSPEIYVVGAEEEVEQRG